MLTDDLDAANFAFKDNLPSGAKHLLPRHLQKEGRQARRMLGLGGACGNRPAWGGLGHTQRLSAP